MYQKGSLMLLPELDQVDAGNLFSNGVGANHPKGLPVVLFDLFYDGIWLALGVERTDSTNLNREGISGIKLFWIWDNFSSLSMYADMISAGKFNVYYPEVSCSYFLIEISFVVNKNANFIIALCDKNK